MDWIERQINDDTVFPSQVGEMMSSPDIIRRWLYFLGTPFLKTFNQISKKMLTRLYRVFVHVYIHHFDKLVAIGAVSYTKSTQLNSFFRRHTSTLATNISTSLSLNLN